MGCLSVCQVSWIDFHWILVMFVSILVYQVIVDQDISCGDYHGGSKELQKDVLSLVNLFSAKMDTVSVKLHSTHQHVNRLTLHSLHLQAQKTATSAWQLLFLLAGNNLTVMSASEAQGLGYSLKATPKRLVFRSPYKQPHSLLGHVSEQKLRSI